MDPERRGTLKLVCERILAVKREMKGGVRERVQAVLERVKDVTVQLGSAAVASLAPG